MEDQQTPAKLPLRQIAIGAVLFIAVLALTFFMVFRQVEPGTLIEAIRSMDARFLVLGLLMMMIYAFMEGLNIQRVLKMSGYSFNPLQCYKYAAIGVFFNAMTPSSSGGQPMQVYYMYCDGIRTSHSILSIFVNLLGYQISVVTLSTIGYLTHLKMLRDAMGTLRWVLLLGIGVNLIIAAAIAVVLYSKATAQAITGAISSAVSKISKKLGARIGAKLQSFIDEYGDCADYLKQNPALLVKTILTSLVQTSAMFCVPFFVYKGLGLPGNPFIHIFLLQAVVFVGVGFIPLPGAMGVSEGTFLLVYQSYFPSEMIANAMIISRSISLYLCILVYGLLIAWWSRRLIFRKKPQSTEQNM